jgi:phage shock protein PspC (stress-responsive transcriptional regulator)
MKKTLTVNLNNIVFHIDDDAYEMLQTYLADVARHLSEDEKKEVMNDIEARVAELFTERLQKNKNVVNLQDVEEIINILGKPSQFSDEDEDEQKQETHKSSTSDKKRARRFYRDPENAVLGGVGAGVAAYFGWDVTWVRIGFVVAALISAGNMIPVYLLVWIIAPKAVTVSQRLEMQGEDVTVESIKTEINNVKNYVESDKFKQSASSFGEKFVEVVQSIARVVFGFLGAVFGFVGMIIVGVLVLALLFFIFEPAVFNGFSPQIMTDLALITPEKATLMILALILVVGCPIFMLIYWAIRIISGRKEQSQTTSWVVFILWIAGLFMLYSVGSQTIIHWNKNANNSWVIDLDDEDLPLKDELRTCESFNSIDVSGNIELTITQDSSQKIVISAPERILPYVKTEVHNGKLKIYTDKVYLNHTIKVAVSADSIYNLEASGACKINTEGKFNTSKLSLDLSGASQARLDVNVADRLSADISGASYADIDGNTVWLVVDASGASKIEADQLTAKFVEVEASGASHARVLATESIDADANGAGEIDCEGSPKTVKRSENMGSTVNIK